MLKKINDFLALYCPLFTPKLSPGDIFYKLKYNLEVNCGVFGKPFFFFWEEQCIGFGGDGAEARDDSGLLNGGDIPG